MLPDELQNLKEETLENPFQSRATVDKPNSSSSTIKKVEFPPPEPSNSEKEKTSSSDQNTKLSKRLAKENEKKSNSNRS